MPSGCVLRQFEGLDDADEDGPSPCKHAIRRLHDWCATLDRTTENRA
jgi:hypothetical protein